MGSVDITARRSEDTHLAGVVLYTVLYDEDGKSISVKFKFRSLQAAGNFLKRFGNMNPAAGVL